MNLLKNEIEKFSSKIKLPKEQASKLESFFNTELSKMHELINFIEDLDNPHNQRIQNIKKENKKKMATYVQSLKKTKEIAESMGDKQQTMKLALILKIFQLFQEDSQKVMNIFSLVKFTNIVRKEFQELHKIRECNCPETINEEFQKTLQLNEKLYALMIAPISEIEHFFDGYNVTKDMIIASTSIYLYKVFKSAFPIQDNTLKEALENVLSSVGISIGINLKTIDGLYLKAIYKDSYIFANATKKEIFPQMTGELYTLAIQESFEFIDFQSYEKLYDYYFQIKAQELLHFLQS